MDFLIGPVNRLRLIVFAVFQPDRDLIAPRAV